MARESLPGDDRRHLGFFSEKMTSHEINKACEHSFSTLSSSTTDVDNPLYLLSPNQPFVNFDLGLTENEKDNLDALNIDFTGHYENYGELELLSEEVSDYIISLGKDNAKLSKEIAGIIIKVINKILTYTKQETAWITLRAFTSVGAFKEPRWHADRYDYPPTGEQYKGAVTLKGASTLFYDAPLEDRKKLEPIKKSKQLLDAAMDKSLLVSAPIGQGTIFIVGADCAPIHSEPDIKSSRLFLSVMPGSKIQIRGVYKQTPEQTIMPLLTAADFYCYFVGPRIKDTFLASPYEDTEIIIFSLSQVLGPKLLSTLSSIVQLHNREIQVESIFDDSYRVKVTLPEGGAIVINDISWFFLERLSKINAEQDLPLILQEYAESTVSSDVSEKGITGVSISDSSKSIKTNSSYKYTFNTISGKNTSGLFKPRAKFKDATPASAAISPGFHS